MDRIDRFIGESGDDNYCKVTIVLRIKPRRAGLSISPIAEITVIPDEMRTALWRSKKTNQWRNNVRELDDALDSFAIEFV